MPDLSSELTAKNIKKAAGSLGQVLSRLVIPLVCILASVGLVALVIVPGIRGIKELREEKVKKEQELGKYEEKSRKLLALKQSEPRLDEELLFVKNALPDEEKIPELMTEVQMISGEVGTALSSLQYGGGKKEPEGAAGASEVKLQMGIEGSYPQIRNLLKAVENAARVVLANQFSISERKEASMSANLSLSSFFLSPPEKQDVNAPITLDLTSSKFNESLEKIKALKVYEVVVEEAEVGKENPFVE